MKRRELMAAMVVALLVGACGDDKMASPAADAAKSVAAPAQTPASSADVAPDAGGALPHSLFGDEYSLDADDPLADTDLENVQVHVEITTNNFAAAHQLAYVRAVQGRSQARQTDAMLAYNQSVYAEVEDPEQNKVDARIKAALNAPATAPANSASAAAATAPQIDETSLLADKNGQWASAAQASSYYGGDTSANPRYGAKQATGSPNVATYSDNPNSWVAKADGVPTAEWLLLDYATAVHATAVKVRQNMGPGAVSKIELVDASGTEHTLWEGLDETAYPKNTIGWFVREFPRTDYLVKQVRVSLRNNRIWGYNEIDAVQLVGSP